jgi:hypothetical protein
MNIALNTQSLNSSVAHARRGSLPSAAYGGAYHDE